MKSIKDEYNNQSNFYDSFIPRLVPNYFEMIESLIKSISNENNFNILDIGCGTGTTSLILKKYFPNAKITCVDISIDMLNIAQEKLKSFSDIEFINNDILELQIDKKFDVIISALISHNIQTLESKKIFYKNIYETLKSNGEYLSIDINTSDNESIKSLYMQKWQEFILQNMTKDEMQKWLELYKSKDKPISTKKEIELLKEVGFIDYEIIYKNYNFSILWSKK